MDIIRNPAKKIRIFDIVNGRFFPGSKEEMKAGYTITPLGEKVSRVNLIGTVINSFVNDDQTYATLTLDDGTETLQIRGFKEDVEKLIKHDLGNLVLVIGKVREYNGEVYVGVETIRKIEDSNVETMRKLEILNELIERKKVVDEIKEMYGKMSREELVNSVQEKFGFDEETLDVVIQNLNVEREVDYKPQILEIISSLDEGEGVEVRKLFQITNLPEN
ncbi:MAG: OB-fold nucleic acid binding domain-containing protein, partial [Candidatus Aenigmatarchaeota archaeon]